MTRYVQRNAEHQIIGDYRQPQPGYAEEPIEEDDPEYVAFVEQTITSFKLPANL